MQSKTNNLSHPHAPSKTKFLRTSFILRLGSLAIWLQTIGCGSYISHYGTSMSATSSTGFENSNGVPYTVGGDPRIIERIEATRNPVDLSPQSGPRNEIEKMDQDLARNIKDLWFVRVNSTGKIDRLGTLEVRGLIHLEKLGPLQFKLPLETLGSGRFTTGRKKIHDQLEIQIDYEDQQNQTASQGTAHLFYKNETNNSKAKPTVVQAQIYLRAYRADIEAIPSIEQKLTAINKEVIELIEKNSYAWVVNTVVYNGISLYEIQVHSSLNPSAPQLTPLAKLVAGKRYFSFMGEALATGDFGDHPAKRLDPGVFQVKSAELMGDENEEDNRTFSIVIAGYHGQDQLDLALKVGRTSAAPPSAISSPSNPHTISPMKVAELRGQKNDAFLKADFSTAHPRVKKNIQDFEQNFDLAGVQGWIKEFQSRAPRRQALLRALHFAQPVRNMVETIFQNYNVAPPASLVTFIESAFFASGNYVLETNPKSTATGPFQLLYGTALDMGLKAHENKIGQLPKAGDHRLFFIPSACGAGKHFASSLDSIAQRDSTMAIAAYYLGNAGVANQIHRSQTKKNPTRKELPSLMQKYNMKYSDVYKQKMLPKHVLDYVNKSLALYFMTGDPKAYNLDWDPQNQPQIPQGKILPPLKEIQDSLCRESIIEYQTSSSLKRM